MGPGIEPASVNGMIPSPQGDPHPVINDKPSEHGQIVTQDFQVSGNLRMAFQHLKDMYEPKVQNQSGPIKPITKEELEREQQQPLQDKADSIPPTITSL